MSFEPPQKGKSRVQFFSDSDASDASNYSDSSNSSDDSESSNDDNAPDQPSDDAEIHDTATDFPINTEKDDDDPQHDEGADHTLNGHDDVVSQNPSNESSEEHESSDDDFDSDDDEDDVRGEIRKENIDRLQKSTLFMALQGFRQTSLARRNVVETDSDTDGSSPERNLAAANEVIPFRAKEVTYEGRRFRKNHCYIMETAEKKQEIVGILKFVSNHVAEGILVVPFDDTILGIEDDGLEYQADYKHESHVQVYKEVKMIELSDLKGEAEDIKEMPALIYEPQRKGSWCQFGYFYDNRRLRWKRKRKTMRSLEFFAGCGGSLQGYHYYKFDTVMAIEKDEMAVTTLKANNEGVPVYSGCIRDFIRHYDTLNCALGKIDHVHFSPPCKGFSTANRNEVSTDKDRTNNDLSLLIIDVLRKTSCATAVFENVVGMWRRKNVHYVKNIVKELLKMNYQVRCATLKACDYGDPQKRPRFFMFISKKSVPFVSLPHKTHGEDNKGDDKLPHVTVEEAFSCLDYNEGAMHNMNLKTTNLRPGQHGLIRLDPDDLAPAIRASSIPPLHYEEDRCINVREAATLQSFPSEYRFHGSITSQYRQVGNAIPINLATAVAHSIYKALADECEEVK